MQPLHPSQQTASQQQEELQNLTDILKVHFPSKELILKEAKAYNKRQQVKRVVKALGTSLGLIFLAIGIADPVLQQQEISTAIGQQAMHTLSDGSQITLNTNAKLRVEMHLRSRKIYLTDGEALFNVKHAWQPFTVFVNRTTIRDIGTVFNVRNDAQGTWVSVLEGAVEVSARHEKQRLEQQQGLLSSNQGLESISTNKLSQINAWQQGKLLFDGTSLSEAITEIQRYRAAPIVISDEKAKKLRISGAYDIAGIDSLISTLPDTLPVKVSHQKNGSVVVKHR
jgi:transmembrane sensor